MKCLVCEQPDVRPFEVVEGRAYWRCERCLATFLDPEHRPSREEEAAQYRLHENDVHDPDYRRFLNRLAIPLSARLTPGSAGLDFGCGPGPALAAMLTGHGHRMAVYDPIFAPDAGVLAREYDFVTCTEVVEHLHQPAETFRRLRSLVRPEGLIAVMTTLQRDDEAFANWHYRRDPTHVVFYRTETFEWLASSAGWRMEVPANNVVFMKSPLRARRGD